MDSNFLLFFVFLLKRSPVIDLQTNILLLVSVQMLLPSAHSAGVATLGLIQISAVEIKHEQRLLLDWELKLTLSYLNQTKSLVGTSVL